MNSRQTRLLKVLDSKVHRSEQQQQQHALPSFIHDTDLECVASLVNDFSKEAVQAFEQAKSGDGKVEMDNVSELYTGLVLVLQLSVSLLTMQDQGRFRELLVEKDTMGNMTSKLWRKEETQGVTTHRPVTTPKIYLDAVRRWASLGSTIWNATVYGLWGRCATMTGGCRTR